ncbi:MAG: hypothetical protein IH586_02615, partial [Anaerolineaceae bacterium]|nr:hypothetical protein [Anaerolineaceae bacterium]
MKINQVTRLPNGLDLKTDIGVMRIQAMNERILHVIYTDQPSLPLAKSLLVIQPTPAVGIGNLIEEEDIIIFEIGELCLEISRNNGAFTWKNNSGGLLVREPERGGKYLHKIHLGVRDAVSTHLDLVFSEEEAIYGLCL